MLQDPYTRESDTSEQAGETPSIVSTEAAQEQAHLDAEQLQEQLLHDEQPKASPKIDRVRFTPKKRRRRFGDRKDGRRIRSLEPINYISPFIMDRRCGCCNYITDRIDIDIIEQYLREKKQQGYMITLMHVLVATYLRTVASYPGINRFLSGQRIYARNNIEVMLTVKKEMRLDSTETVIKCVFRPDDTIFDVYDEFNRLITEYRSNTTNSLDRLAGFLNKIPRVILRGVVGILKFMDYFGWLPRALTDTSCFHGSFFITSMGSLGIPPIYHHLYDFGNVPLFLSFGAKQRRNVLEDDGSIRKEHYIDFTVVTDERICDGFYFASALKHMKKILKNPWLLEEPPQEVIEDID